MYLFWHVVYRLCLASPTLSRIYLSPLWTVEDNAPCSTSFACGLLALPSLTHTLKDLPVSCKVGASNLACRYENGVIIRHKERVITNIIAQGQTHIESSQVNVFKIYSLLPSSFIRYFNNQIFTVFSKSSKPFIVKKKKTASTFPVIKASVNFANNTINP